MNKLYIPLTKLDNSLETPAYAYPGDAGVDLRASCDAVLQPFERKLIPTGLAIALPGGYAGFVVPRSGLAINKGISLVNSPGLIDSNYRGEIKAILINLDPSTAFEIKKGDRIAQLVVMAIPEVTFQDCQELPPSQRGSQGFGSSGVSN